MDYDVLVLGGGIIGCAISYELSKYNLNIALIEKDYDIADDISLENTAIVYDGSEAINEQMAEFEIMGNAMFDKLTKSFNVPFKRVCSLTLAKNQEEKEKIEQRYKKAIERGIRNIFIVDQKDIKEIEPNLGEKFLSALYCKNTGVVAPYDLAIAYAEIAYDNGVSFKLEEVVLDVQKIAKGIRVTTNKNRFTCKMVINTIEYDNYTIDSNKVIQKKNTYPMTYINLENRFEGRLSNVIFNPTENNKGIKAVPTLEDGMLVGLCDHEHLDFQKAIRGAQGILHEIKKQEINSYTKSFVSFDNITINNNGKGYMKIQGDSYAEITITPAIASKVSEIVREYLKCVPNKNFIHKRREFYRFKNMTMEERNDIISHDKRYGKIVCLCNQVTEGEIVDSIRRPLGARTVEGVKRRTGASFGSCHGAYCINKIIEILAREMDKKPIDLVEDSKNSKVLVGRIKEFDEI